MPERTQAQFWFFGATLGYGLYEVLRKGKAKKIKVFKVREGEFRNMWRVTW